ncbi:MAG: L,D-transpeptidase [Chitinophagaceae bacterium]|nr:L,D-transpeptidase [Chitinophagaceae bacterium]
MKEVERSVALKFRYIIYVIALCSLQSCASEGGSTPKVPDVPVSRDTIPHEMPKASLNDLDLPKDSLNLIRKRDSILSLPKDTVTRSHRQLRDEQVAEYLFRLSQIKRDTTRSKDCRQQQCALWAHVILSEQKLYLYVQGQLIDTFKVSTGIKGRETPEMDKRPDGRMYKKYTSNKFPGGNYMGLGNMPYVVFISGGFAIHGTTKGNIKKLGKRASHGCIRLHPDNGRIFYEMVKAAGNKNTWVTISKS